MVEIFRGPGVAGFDVASGLPRGVVSPSEHRMGLSGMTLFEGIYMDRATAAAISTSTSSRDLVVQGATAAIRAPLGGWYCPSWRSAVTLTPSVAGSQDRIDVVAVRQSDYELDAAAVDSKAELVLVQGTPSATPSQPSLGDGMLGLYAVRVKAGTTSSSQWTITRLFEWTTAVGGCPSFSSEAARTRMLPSPIEGQMCTTGSGGSLIVWLRQGTAWVPLMQQGAASIYGGWSGYVRWQQVGRMVTAEMAVTRTDGGFTIGAWQGASFARGLPPARAVPTSGQLSLLRTHLVTNISSDANAFAPSVGTTGIAYIEAIWSDRWVSQGGWLSGSFSYEVAS